MSDGTEDSEGLMRALFGDDWKPLPPGSAKHIKDFTDQTRASLLRMRAKIADDCNDSYHPKTYPNPWPPLPMVRTRDGRVRFRCNEIVRYLLDAGPFDLNQLSVMPFSVEDYEHFMQLIGYSLDGFGELSTTSDLTYDRAALAAEALEACEPKS